MSIKKRPYVGTKRNSNESDMIMSATPVTTDSHPQYRKVKGAFRTKKAAMNVASHANPDALDDKSISELEELFGGSDSPDLDDDSDSEGDGQDAA